MADVNNPIANLSIEDLMKLTEKPIDQYRSDSAAASKRYEAPDGAPLIIVPKPLSRNGNIPCLIGAAVADSALALLSNSSFVGGNIESAGVRYNFSKGVSSAI